MKYSPFSFLAVVLVAFGGWTAPLSAAVLVSYTFNSGNGNPAPTDEALSASVAAWNGYASGVGFSSTTQSAYVSGTVLSKTFTTTQYLSFTVEAAEGSLLDLDSITIELGGSIPASGTTSQNSALQVRTSGDEFASSLVFTPGGSTEALITVSEIGKTEYAFFTVDLSGLAPTGSITFHLHPYGPPPLSGSNFLRFGSVELEGQIVAVPEASTFGFGLVGAAMLLGLVRRSRRLARFSHL